MSNWTDDFVRARARELWEAAGQPEGRDLEFWLQAEQETGAPAQGTAPENPVDDVASVAVAAEGGWVGSPVI
jgi:hypothetical protein